MNLLTKNPNTSRMNLEKTDKVFPIKGHKNVSLWEKYSRGLHM